jgi:hypothetical protein
VKLTAHLHLAQVYLHSPIPLNGVVLSKYLSAVTLSYIKVFIYKSEGERVIGRPRRRWEDIRIDAREVEWEGVGWMHPTQDRDQWQAFVNTVINLRIS